MIAAEGKAVVVDHAAVGNVEGSNGSGEAFAEIFAHREIESGVTGEVVALVRPAGSAIFSVAESGAVVNVGRGIGAPGKANVAAHVERITLVMVKRAESGSEREIGETAGDGAAALGDLVGIGKVNLTAMRNAGRAEREFPSAD